MDDCLGRIGHFFGNQKPSLPWRCLGKDQPVPKGTLGGFHGRGIRKGGELNKDTVFLVHGFLGSPVEFLPLKFWLGRKGFDVRLWGHFTVNKGIEGHAHDFLKWIEEQSEGRSWSRVHFVGHSMGAIIVRRVLDLLHQGGRGEYLNGRAVLMAPPNRGSHVASAMPNLVRDGVAAIRDLTDHPESYVNCLPQQMPIESGIIWTQTDHMVRPSSARIPVSGGDIEVKGLHSSILFSPRVAELTASFLRTGRFHGG